MVLSCVRIEPGLFTILWQRPRALKIATQAFGVGESGSQPGEASARWEKRKGGQAEENKPGYERGGDVRPSSQVGRGGEGQSRGRGGGGGRRRGEMFR